MTSNQVRTVLGDVAASELGPCDYHEHLFQVSQLLPGEELDNERLSGAEAAAMAAAGLTAMVEATPTALGRNPAAVARISAATGLRAIHTTGAHHQGHYPAGHWLEEASAQDLADRFSNDVTNGLPDVATPDADGPARAPVALSPLGQPVRAGLIKAGIGYWRISPFERRCLDAAASAALTTGASVMVHLEYGTAAWETLAILDQAGLAADRVVLAHLDRNLDPGLHAELTAAGSYIGYDGMARHRQSPDSALIDCLEAALRRGGDPKRFLVGADVARATRFKAYGGMPGLTYLPERFWPRVVRAVGADIAQEIIERNPARLLALRPPV
ncbi:MAG: hypothetical protein LBS27_07640 [Bifidobacteriaceae bacterium]|jgi:phosphotriesterase-related protein|nr:hypothetical protein [Bifidobacteriaceae bacterium]